MQIYDSRGYKLPLPTGGGGATFSAGVSTGGNTLGNTGTVSNQAIFAGINGITLSQSTGAGGATITISGPGAGAVGSISAGTTRLTLGEAVFSNLNGLSFGVDGQTVTASHNALTSQSNQAISGQNGSFTFQTVSFSNANGISFGTSAGPAMTASHNAITSQSNQQMTMFATGNTTQSSTGTSNASSLVFRGDGVASIGITNGSIVVSVPSALTNIGVSAGTTSNLLSAITFSNANGVSFGINASTITASVAAAGGGATLSFWNETNAMGSGRAATSFGNGSVLVWPVLIQQQVTASRWKASISVGLSTSSNSSHGGTLSFNVGIFTRNVSTLNLATTGSTTYAWTNTSNNSVASLSGLREISGSFGALNLTPGEYWFAIWSRTSTVNANWFTASNVMHGTSQSNSTHSGNFAAAAGAASFQPGIVGQGTYSATSTTMPASIAFSHITGTARWWYRPHLAFVNFQA